MLHGLLIHKNIRIPLPKNVWVPPVPPTLHLVGQWWDFQKMSQSLETLCMTSEGLGEMFKANIADTCAEKWGAEQRI